MADSWFTLEDGIACGPHTEAELQTRYMWGELDDAVPLWKMEKDGAGRSAAPITVGTAAFLVKRPATWPAPDHKHASEHEELNGAAHRSRAFVHLMTSGGFAAVAGTICAVGIRTMERAQVLFVCELAAFVGMWFAYFMSRHGNVGGFFEVPTLRRLLRLTAKTWDQNKRDFGESFRAKAEKTISATAMLVATSGVVLGRAADSYHNWEIANPKPPGYWQPGLCIVALLSGFTALVCFVLSVDSLDAVANNFATRSLTTRLRAHFYMSTINPRYFGFVLLLSSIVAMFAVKNALLGCAALTIIVGVGYTHWFPPVDVLTNAIGREDRSKAARRGVAVFVGRSFALALPMILVWKFPAPTPGFYDQQVARNAAPRPATSPR